MSFFSVTCQATWPDSLRGAVLALGNFDGFHLGHQAVAGKALELAKERDVPCVIATFDPHPVRFFKPDAAPFRLTSLDQRAALFEAFGADGMLVFNFNAEMAALTAEEFVRDLLAGEYGLTGVVTGEDFTFGKGREGNVAMLAQLGAQYDIEARAVAPVMQGNESVSSSRIRSALQEGKPQVATRLMTRPFTIRSEVLHGHKEGRKLGYPTANMLLGPYLRPKYGVYAVRGRLPDGRMLNGVANIGIRPMFDPPEEWLETYFFDFSGDLYGQTLDIELIDYLRGEAKFDDMDALIVQMDADSARARQILGC